MSTPRSRGISSASKKGIGEATTNREDKEKRKAVANFEEFDQAVDFKRHVLIQREKEDSRVENHEWSEDSDASRDSSRMDKQEIQKSPGKFSQFSPYHNNNVDLKFVVKTPEGLEVGRTPVSRRHQSQPGSPELKPTEGKRRLSLFAMHKMKSNKNLILETKKSDKIASVADADEKSPKLGRRMTRMSILSRHENDSSLDDADGSEAASPTISRGSKRPSIDMHNEGIGLLESAKSKNDSTSHQDSEKDKNEGKTPKSEDGEVQFSDEGAEAREPNKQKSNIISLKGEESEKRLRSLSREPTTGRYRLSNDEKYRHLKWIIFPDDRFRIMWDGLMVLILIYTAVLLPLRLSFLDFFDNNNAWLIADALTDGTFFVDVLINFCCAYYDSQENLVVDKHVIFQNYVSGWFFIDMISCLPFEIFVFNNKTNLRLIKLLKLVRLLKIFKEKDKFLRYMNEIVKLNTGMERLVMSVIILALFCHIMSCFWYLTLLLTVDQADNWLYKFDFIDFDVGEIYVASLYLVVQTVVTVGYGDLHPGTTTERAVACIWMAIGAFIYSFFIGSVASLLSSNEAQNAIYHQKMNVLILIKKDFKLNHSLYGKLKNALKYGHKTTQDNQQFLNELPHNLRTELACIMHKDIVENIAFFQGKPKNFIAYIGPLLKPIKVAKNEFVYMEGDPADEIYFIKSGKVAFVLREHKNFKFLKVKSGYFFGEMDLLFYGEVRKYTAMAVRESEFYVLNKKYFKEVFFVEYRDIGMEIVQNAYERKLRTRKVYKEALNFCKSVKSEKAGVRRRGRNSKAALTFYRGPTGESVNKLSEESDADQDNVIHEDLEEEDQQDTERDKNEDQPKDMEDEKAISNESQKGSSSEIKDENGGGTPKDRKTTVTSVTSANPGRKFKNLGKLAIMSKNIFSQPQNSMFGQPQNSLFGQPQNSLFGPTESPLFGQPQSLAQSYLGGHANKKVDELNKKFDDLEDKMQKLLEIAETVKAKYRKDDYSAESSLATTFTRAETRPLNGTLTTMTKVETPISQKHGGRDSPVSNMSFKPKGLLQKSPSLDISKVIELNPKTSSHMLKPENKKRNSIPNLGDVQAKPMGLIERLKLLKKKEEEEEKMAGRAGSQSPGSSGGHVEKITSEENVSPTDKAAKMTPKSKVNIVPRINLDTSPKDINNRSSSMDKVPKVSLFSKAVRPGAVDVGKSVAKVEKTAELSKVESVKEDEVVQSEKVDSVRKSSENQPNSSDKYDNPKSQRKTPRMAKLEQIGKIGSTKSSERSIFEGRPRIDFKQETTQTTAVSNRQISSYNHTESPVNSSLNSFPAKIEESHRVNDRLVSIDQDLTNESEASRFFMEPSEFKKLANKMNDKFFKPHEVSNKSANKSSSLSRSTAIDQDSKKISHLYASLSHSKSGMTGNGLLSIPASLNASSDVRNASSQQRSMSRITIEDLRMDQEEEEGEEQDKFMFDMDGNS